MSSSHITHDHLKNIAGLVQKLSYRDMLQFAEILSKDLKKNDDDEPLTVATSLLKAADEIAGLSRDDKKPGVTYRGPGRDHDRLG